MLYSSHKRECFAIAAWTLLANSPLGSACSHVHFFAATFRQMVAVGAVNITQLPHYSPSLKCGAVSRAVEVRYGEALDRFQVSLDHVQGGMGSPLLEALLVAEAQLTVSALWERTVLRRTYWYKREAGTATFSSQYVPYRHSGSSLVDVILVECETPSLGRIATEHAGPLGFSAEMVYVGSLLAVRMPSKADSEHEVAMLAPLHTALPSDQPAEKIVCDNDKTRSLASLVAEYEVSHLTDVWCRRSLLPAC